MSERITLSDLYQAKQDGKKLVAVSCFDHTTARLVASAGVDMILVGDSAAQMLLGYDSTLRATMDFMLILTEAVRRAAPHVFLIADMPFLSYQTCIADAVRNAGRFICECGAQLVKFEVKESQLDIIKAVSDADIPVMAHLGIRPQSILRQGKFKAEGVTAESAYKLIDLAQRAIDAGASALLLEGTARETAGIITKQSFVPVISCGSGPDCDGQVLIINDILGLTDLAPRFAQAYTELPPAISRAVGQYAGEIRDGRFPDDEHCYHIKEGQMELLQKMLSNRSNGKI